MPRSSKHDELEGWYDGYGVAFVRIWPFANV